MGNILSTPMGNPPSPPSSSADSAAMSISSDGNEEIDRWQCCVCELKDWVYPSNDPGERCWRCGHDECGWCAHFVRVTEWVMEVEGGAENGDEVEGGEEEDEEDEDEQEAENWWEL